MPKTLIVYGSTTGNTEGLAETIAEVLIIEGFEVEVRNASSVSAENLAEGFDAVLLGSSTWGDEDIEFQEDFEPLYDNLDKTGITDKPVAMFGCGDSSYTHFCGAVTATQEKAEQLGAKVMVDALKIDGDPEMDEVMAWSKSVASKLKDAFAA